MASDLARWIEAVRRQRGAWGLPMQPGCPKRETTRPLRASSLDRLGIEPPRPYLDLLESTNGIDENGMQLYASRKSRDVASDILGCEGIVPGFVEENENLRAVRQDYDQLLVFGQSELYVYALEFEPNKYIVLGHGDQDACEVYDTFDDLMASAFRRILKPQFLPT